MSRAYVRHAGRARPCAAYEQPQPARAAATRSSASSPARARGRCREHGEGQQPAERSVTTPASEPTPARVPVLTRATPAAATLSGEWKRPATVPVKPATGRAASKRPQLGMSRSGSGRQHADDRLGRHPVEPGQAARVVHAADRLRDAQRGQGRLNGLHGTIEGRRSAGRARAEPAERLGDVVVADGQHPLDQGGNRGAVHCRERAAAGRSGAEADGGHRDAHCGERGAERSTGRERRGEGPRRRQHARRVAAAVRLGRLDRRN